MTKGRIVEEGDPTTILTNPSHERTRAFLNAVLSDGAGGVRPEAQVDARRSDSSSGPSIA